MVARREREPLSPRASAGGAGAEGASSHDDDVKFWRERALRLAESGQAGPSGDAFGEGRRPGAAAAALDALLRPRASADGTRVGRSTSTSGGRASARRALDTNPTSVGPAGDGTKTRRAETHAAVALHAVAADLTERAEAVDAELAALAERKADAREARARAGRPRAARGRAAGTRARSHRATGGGCRAESPPAPRTRASTTDPRRFGFAKRRRARATRATLSRATRRSRTRHRRSPKMKRRRRRRRRRRISFRKKKTAPRA